MRAALPGARRDPGDARRRGYPALTPGPAVALAWASAGRPLPAWALQACAARGLAVRDVPRVQDAVDAVRRGRPRLVLVAAYDAAAAPDAEWLVRMLKADAYTAVVPCLVVAAPEGESGWLDAGADEVLAPDAAAGVAESRLTALLRRSARDLAAQPTTRLPAASAIDADINRRVAEGARFAACYADLDHFKEFNDRYGFREGDRVIRMLARVLHDCVVGVAGSDGFAGHIGGDDFMLVVPLEQAAPVCELAIATFDALAPYQYSEGDRRAGYYFGKDRRGYLHRVPLMTLSIGVATNERRRFDSAAEVARLASEMKSFAKARPGSVYAVDQRADDTPPKATGRSATPTQPPTTTSP